MSASSSSEQKSRMIIIIAILLALMVGGGLTLPSMMNKMAEEKKAQQERQVRQEKALQLVAAEAAVLNNDLQSLKMKLQQPEIKENIPLLISEAIYRGKAPALSLLLEQYRLNPKDSIWLNQAVSYGHAEIVQVLVLKGMGLNNRDSIFGETPLFVAVSKNHRRIAEDLLKAGADPNIARNPKGPQDVGGFTVGTQYSEAERKKIVAKLAAEQRTRYELGTTPLIWAAGLGNREMVELLLQYGANSKMKTASGKTAIDLASHFNHTDMVKYLKSRLSLAAR